MSSFSLPYLLLLSGLLGLMIGSFVSLLSWRLPRLMMLEEDEQFKAITFGGSQCPHCEAKIPWYRLIPFFSWLLIRLFAGGKCHSCEEKISPRYPLIELATAAATVAMVWFFGLTTEGIAAVIFTWILITICVIDLEHHLILDNLSLPLLWIGLLFNSQSLFTTPTDAIWGAVIGYLILWLIFHGFKLITGKEGMGYGDFKMLAALGAWFGVAALPQIILIAAISSLLIGLIAIALKLKKLDSPLAFGPFLAIGGWTTLIIGTNML